MESTVEPFDKLLHQLRVRNIQQKENGIQREDHTESQLLRQHQFCKELDFHTLVEFQFRHGQNRIHELFDHPRYALLDDECQLHPGGTLQIVQLPHQCEVVVTLRPETGQIGQLVPQRARLVLTAPIFTTGLHRNIRTFTRSNRHTANLMIYGKRTVTGKTIASADQTYRRTVIGAERHDRNGTGILPFRSRNEIGHGR